MAEITPQNTGQNDYNELLPTEGDPKVGPRVFELLAEIIADKDKLGLPSKWHRGYELRKNKHWRSKPSQKVPLVSANLIGVHIQRTANTLTDNNPTFNVVQTGQVEEGMQGQVDILQKTCEYWWNETEQQDDYEETIINGECYGITVEKSVFNEELEDGLGEAETVIVDPYHFGVYPVKWKNCKDIQKSLACLHFYPLSIREIKQKYGKKAEDVKPDQEFINDLGDERREINAQQGTDQRGTSVMVTVLNTIRNLVNIGKSEEEKSDEALIVECWCRDYSQENEGEEELQEDGTLIQNKKPKYPGNIRMVVTVNGGKIVLDDVPNPNINQSLPDDKARMTYLYSRFPFAAANSAKDGVSGWGMSDLEQLEWLQTEFNKALSQLVLEKDRAARRKIINPKTSGVPNEQFTNFPGIINPVNTIEAVGIRYLDYPQMPVDINNAITLFKDLFFIVSGSFDIDQAQVPGRNVIAYKAIAALMERASTMMRGKIRSYSRLIRERGRMYLSHVMNFYTEDRWITTSEQDGTTTPMKINGASLIMPAKLTVVTGSTMPISRVAQREEALELFKMRAIDGQELLTKLDWSSRGDVIKRMMQGPLSAAANNYQTMGMPQQLIQLLMNVAQIPPKDMTKFLEDGTVPDFKTLAGMVQGLMTGQPQEEGPSQQEGAEVALKIAQAKKLEAEAMLTIEKIASERLAQEKTIAGVRFDKEKLKIERAKVIGAIETEVNKMMVGQENQGVFNEKGMRSNNLSS